MFKAIALPMLASRLETVALHLAETASLILELASVQTLPT
jgi:hypothetical protein